MLLGFVQNWFAPRANPIGVDFGTDCIRMAQVQWTGQEYRLAAAASADVPHHVRRDPHARLEYFVEAARELLTSGQFRGRQAVLGLPAATMAIQHVRMPKLDDNETKKALPHEVRGKLPIDPSHALIRHLVAGEVYQEQELLNEVIVMAASREWVNQFLAAASRAKLDVIGMNVEPKAIVDCFAQVYRRKTDMDVTSCFLDVGCTGTRVVIARGQQVLFARSIPIGGDHFTRAAAQELRQGLDETRLLRLKLAASAAPALDDHRERHTVATGESEATPPPAAVAEDARFALLDAVAPESPERAKVSTAPAAAQPAARPEADIARRVEQACREPLNRLVEELELCRRYHESTFPDKPVNRLVFVGGEARQRALCQHVARELGIAAQLGDPLVRMGRISDVGLESGIDRRQPQPAWTTAIGLSLGPSKPQARGAGSEARTEARA
jgi:type IV pilus assembly protein PilM